MSANGRTVSLKTRHADLDREVRTELNRPLPDPNRIAYLKREKLRLKDALVGLQTMMAKRQQANHTAQ